MNLILEVVMKAGIIRGSFVAGVLGCLVVAAVSYGKDVLPAASPDTVLQALKDGNKRFTSGKMTHPSQSKERLTQIAKAQHPVAVVVSCSDSRVPPEIVFDQGMGDLFVVRTAGEVVKEVELGSIEYAVEHLHVPLIIVLGHKRCGAVEAAVKGGVAPGNIASIVELVKPAVDEAKNQKGDVLDNAVKINVRMVSEKIKSSEIVGHFTKEKRVKVVKGYYDLDDGTVTIME
jgi:carbonic anhydrase